MKKITPQLASCLMATLAFCGLFCFQNSYAAKENKLLLGGFIEEIPTISSGGITTFCSGSSVLLTSSDAVSYQWFKDGQPISGANGRTYTATQSGAYQVQVMYADSTQEISEALDIKQLNHWIGAAGDNNWNNATNWSCGVVPRTTDHVKISDLDSAPQIDNNSNVKVYSLSLEPYSELKVHAGSTLTVVDAISVDPQASLILLDQASLVQFNDVANSGNIIAMKSTMPMKKFDFTYWSSPVTGQTLHELSPETLSDKFYSYDPVAGNWVTHLNGASVMDVAKGYIIRAPQSFSPTVATVFDDAQFIGVPNNGHIETPVSVGSSDMNLIGNPYPSAIDIDEFLTNETNAALTGGTIYLWTHNSAPAVIEGDATYNYTSNDYVTYNLLGGVSTSTSGNNATPTGKVASGQGFFIQALGDGNVVFENNMRVVSQNDQFFRLINNEPVQSVEKNRLWLNLSNNQGAFKQTLIGFVPGATEAFDHKFDGPVLNGNSFINFYSLIGDQRLSIQGRGLPFDQSQQIPLGYSTSVAGPYTIGIDRFDGLFAQQDVFLVDHSDESVHNLKEGDYVFETASGTFNNRFEVRFGNAALAVDQEAETADAIVAWIENGQVKVKSTTAITEISMIDLLGRILYEEENINALFFDTEVPSGAHQPLVVKIKCGNQSSVKKLCVE